ncbi:MAG: hypothetical protein ACLRM9_00820 [Collinsella aerofaciens]
MGFVMSDGMENPKTGPDLQAVARNRQRFGEKNTTTVCGTLKGIGSTRVRLQLPRLHRRCRRNRL